MDYHVLELSRLVPAQLCRHIIKLLVKASISKHVSSPDQLLISLHKYCYEHSMLLRGPNTNTCTYLQEGVYSARHFIVKPILENIS